MVKKKVVRKHSSKEDDKIFAFLGVFLTIIGFIIVLLTKKDSKYVMYYGKQGLVLFIAYVIVMVVAIVPIIGWILSIIGWIILLVLWIIGIINSFSGHMKPMPILQQFADKINI